MRKSAPAASSGAPAEWREFLQTALGEAEAERHHQLRERGLQRHSFRTWHTILSEEVGELAAEILRECFASNSSRSIPAKLRIRAEAIQVAAVALAIVQAVDSGSA